MLFLKSLKMDARAFKKKGFIGDNVVQDVFLSFPEEKFFFFVLFLFVVSA